MTGAVYAIADAEALHPRHLAGAVAEMAEAGIRWIQVRAKKLSGESWHRVLADCRRALEGSGAELWVDDRADLAALFPVSGRSPRTGGPPFGCSEAGGGPRRADRPVDAR